MKVNDNKFDKAIHRPMETAKKIQHLENMINVCEGLIKSLSLILKEIVMEANHMKQDLVMYRTDMLESVNNKEVKE